MSSLPQLSGRHRRMVWLGVVWIGCGLIVIARLAWWQLFPHPDLRLYGQPGTGGVQTTPPIRGNILDANGHYLAVSTIGYKVGVSPDVLSNEERESLVPLVAELLDLDQNQVRSALATKGQAYVPLEIVKLYSFEQAHALSALSPAAFVLEPKFVRAYPDETLAASILGFLSAWKSEGNYGLEQYYERELKGVEGTWQGLDDAWGAQIPLGTDGYKPPENGADLTLTLDRNIQAIAETILKEGIEQN
jgi:stage V sporulation protein D (sporulation-specific penicillin-binding protein)